MIRSRAFVGCLISASLLFAAACKKDEKKAEKSEDKSGEKSASAEKSGGDSSGGAASGGSDLALLPKDVDVVFGMNMAQMMKSKLFTDFAVPQMEKTGEFKKFAEEFKTKCGMDWKDSVSTGTGGVKVSTKEVTLAISGVDKTKTLACFEKMKDSMAEQGTEYTKDGDVIVMKSKDAAASSALTFVDNDTMLMVMGPTASKDTVLAAAKIDTKKSLKESSQFVSIYSKVKSSDSIWFIVNTAAIAPLDEQLKKFNIDARAIAGSFNITDKVDVDVRIRAASEEAAKSVEGLVGGFQKTAESFVGPLKIEREGNDVHASVSITQEKLSMIGSTMKSMMPNIPGM